MVDHRVVQVKAAITPVTKHTAKTGGTHIKLDRPPVNSREYGDRKTFKTRKPREPIGPLDQASQRPGVVASLKNCGISIDIQKRQSAAQNSVTERHGAWRPDLGDGEARTEMLRIGRAQERLDTHALLRKVMSAPRLQQNEIARMKEGVGA